MLRYLYLLKVCSMVVSQTSDIYSLFSAVPHSIGTSCLDLMTCWMPFLAALWCEQSHSHGAGVDEGYGVMSEEVKVSSKGRVVQ